MSRVTYQGPHDAVDLPGGGSVERGKSVNLPKRLAAELVARGDFIDEREES